MPKTRFQMLLRGQNVVGYHNYPDDIVQAFVQRAAANGIDVFRIFDAMNDVRNMKTAIEAGAQEPASWSKERSATRSVPCTRRIISCVWRRKLADMGVQIICLKDMGGLLAPYAAYEIIKKIKSRIALPLHLHSHCTAGLAPMSLHDGHRSGRGYSRHGDLRRSPKARRSRPPSRSSPALMGTPHDTGLDLAKLAKIAGIFTQCGANYAEFESPVNNQIKTDVLISQIPGGMLSNLVAQLRQQKAEDKLEAVLAEMPHVRKDLGYPPLGDADQPDGRLPSGAQRHDRETLFRRRDGDTKLCHGAVRRTAGPDQR